MNTTYTFRTRCIVTWVLQFAGALILLALGYWWLTWPDEKTWQVLASLVVAAVAVCACLWMECGVFAAFHREDESGLRLRPGRLSAFAIWVLAFLAAEVLLMGFYANAERFAVRFAQVTHLPPRAAVSVFDWGTWVLIWIAIPAILLPTGSLIARDGFAALSSSGLRIAVRAWKRSRYWIGLALTLLAGAWVPRLLINWIPERATLRGELWSAGLRLSAAYLLMVTALVCLSWNMARVLGNREDVQAASSAEPSSAPA